MNTSILPLLANSSAYKAGETMGTAIGFILMLIIPAVFILSLVMLIVTKRKLWIIGLILSSLAGLALVVSVAYIAVKTYKDGATAATEITDTKVVSTDDGLLQLTIPESWKSLGNISEDATLQYGSLVGEQYCIVISEVKTDFDETYTLKDYAEQCLKNVEDQASKYQRSEWLTSEVGGCSLLEVQADATIDKTKIKYHNGYLETDTHYHQIMQWTLPSKWEGSEPVFKSVLESIMQP